MGIDKGSFAGISSSTVAMKRKWDVAFGKDDVSRESLSCNKRKDIKLLLQKQVSKGELSQDLLDSISSTDVLPHADQIFNCLRMTTSVPMNQALAEEDIGNRDAGGLFSCFCSPFRQLRMPPT